MPVTFGGLGLPRGADEIRADSMRLSALARVGEHVRTLGLRTLGFGCT